MSNSPIPFYFGSSERPLFGWLHLPSDHGSRSVGLVICNPLGYEYLCAHRTIKHFAQSAASNGWPTLRFDYDGTGDSAGSDLESGRLQHWIRSIHAAIDELKARSGVQLVCLLGIRLGATLAALAAAERHDVPGIAGIVPIPKVRTYLRELRALALSRPKPQPSALDAPAVAQDAGLQESAGFVLTSATQDELNGIDLTKLDRLPPELLLIERDDLPGQSDWLTTAERLGVNVEHRRLPGYTEMMLDSHEAVVPTMMLQTTMDWLTRVGSANEPASSPTFGDVRKHAQFTVDNSSVARVVEHATYVDEKASVFGIVSVPLESPEGASRSAVLLLNSGAVHHVGPNRIYVSLARRWAMAGAVVLRLDLSGLGDSSTRDGEHENVVYGRRALEDVDAAISFLKTRYPDREIHVMGVCSGAYHSFKAAVSGASVRSVVAINPLTFAWRQGMSLAFPEYRIAADALRYRKNAFRLESWMKLLSGGVDIPQLIQVLYRRACGKARAYLRDLCRRMGISFRNDLGSELHGIADRGTNLLFVFAKGEPGFDLLKTGGGSVVERLRRRGLLSIEFIDGADHTFTSYLAREHLFRVLTSHMCPNNDLA